MLAKFAQTLHFTVMCGEQLGVTGDDLGDFAERRRRGDLLSVESCAEFREQPWPSEAAASDDDAVAAGLVHHAGSIRGVEDVAVAEDRHVGDVFLEARDLVPVSSAGVALRRGTCVKCDGSSAFSCGDPAGVEVRVMFGVDADAHLDGDRNVGAFGGAHGCRDDLTEQSTLVR